MDEGGGFFEWTWDCRDVCGNVDVHFVRCREGVVRYNRCERFKTGKDAVNRSPSSFGSERRKICPHETGCLCCKSLVIKISVEFELLAKNPEDLLSRFFVGDCEADLLFKTSGPAKRRVKTVRSICSSNDQYWFAIVLLRFEVC